MADPGIRPVDGSSILRSFCSHAHRQWLYIALGSEGRSLSEKLNHLRRVEGNLALTTERIAKVGLIALNRSEDRTLGLRVEVARHTYVSDRSQNIHLVIKT